ncbi:hypothetical protein MNBD_PLANCTO02-1922 [hydrothermal vent metagenome]|uniref:DUF11 domain-containing protein n=1 Tax=hydrothermal vent metagenome TaxID=652676 RepID=A0A3B1E3L1_9ZZZZ
MRRSAFKITVLLGIIALGFWAVLQAQNGLKGFRFSQKEKTDVSKEETLTASHQQANKRKKSSSLPADKEEKSDFMQNPFAETGEKKIETASFQVQDKSSDEESPFFQKEEGLKEASQSETRENSKKKSHRGVDFRDEQPESPFVSSSENKNVFIKKEEREATKELPPWEGNDREKISPSPFPEKSALPPAKLTLPSEAKAIKKSDAKGPQFVELTQNKSGEEKKSENPFGQFEEQKTENKQPKLPLIIPDNKNETPIFPKDDNDAGKSKEVKITPLNLQEEEPTVVQEKIETAPLFPSDRVSKLKPAKPKEDDRFDKETIGDRSIPRGAGHPQLSIRKIAPKKAALGEKMVYKIIVRNTGSTTAQKVIVEDRIPKGSKLDKTKPQAEKRGKRLTWKLGTMKPGAEKVILVRVIPTTTGQIGSVALVNFVSEVAAETMVTAPKLALTLTGPQATTVGEPLVYKFRVTNIGSAMAKKVYILNLLPNELEHPNGGDLESEIGSLGVGQSREIKLTVTARAEGKVINKATAVAEGGFKAEASIAVKIDGPILSITRSGPKHRYLGRPARFDNNVKNESDSTIQQVIIVEEIPDGFRFDKASAGGKYNSQKGEIIWQIKNLKAGETRRLSAIVTGHSIGTRRSVVKAYARNLLRAEVTSETVVAGYPKLQTSVAGGEKPIEAGSHVTYQIRINNKGTAQAENVNITLSVPPQLKFVSAKGATFKQISRDKIQISSTQNISAKKGIIFYATFKAVAEGEGSVGVHAQGDHMKRPITHDEEVRVYE